MPTSVLPPLAARQQVEARIQDLVDAVLAHPQMQPPNRHPTLYHIWDFAMRSKYILSELDNIEGGFAVEHPEQIADYDKSTEGTPNPAKAKELLNDVAGRSMTLDMLIDPPNPIMLAMMGLQPVDAGEEVKRKSKAVVEAVEQLDARANRKQ